MEEKEKKKKVKLLKIKELPSDLQEYFILRLAGMFALYIGFIVISVVVKSWMLLFVLTATVIGMLVWMFINLYKISSGQIRAFEGVFERFESSYKEKPSAIIGTYGSASVTIKLDENLFLKAQVPGNFSASDDSIIRIYVDKNTLIDENDNTAYAPAPLLVKICKNQ